MHSVVYESYNKHLLLTFSCPGNIIRSFKETLQSVLLQLATIRADLKLLVMCSYFHLFKTASDSPYLNFCFLSAGAKMWNRLFSLSHTTNIFQSLLPPAPLFCLCITSYQAELLWLCLSSGIFILVFVALYVRTARTNESPTNQMLKYISLQLHTTYLCYADLGTLFYFFTLDSFLHLLFTFSLLLPSSHK